MIADAIAFAAESLGDDAARVLARVRGLGAASGRPRAQVLATVRAPVPPALRAVHPTWIEHGLGELPERARTVLGTSARNDIDVWLARCATAALPPIVETRDTLAWLMAVGADQMAFALGEPARAMPMLATAAVRITKPPRDGQLGPKRAAIERCRDIALDDELAFVRVASRALAPHLAADQLAQLQTILTLPRPLGLVVAREVALHARASIDQVPTWAASTAR